MMDEENDIYYNPVKYQYKILCCLGCTKIIKFDKLYSGLKYALFTINMSIFVIFVYSTIQVFHIKTLFVGSMFFPLPLEFYFSFFLI
jgi:hypothetical protein